MLLKESLPLRVEGEDCQAAKMGWGGVRVRVKYYSFFSVKFQI